MKWIAVLLLFFVTIIALLNFADTILLVLAPLLNRIAQKLGLQSLASNPGDDYVGKTATITQIGPDHDTLRVELGGTTWRAMIEEIGELKLGDAVRVVRVDGLTLVVERAEQAR